MVLLLWFYVSGIALLLGAELNAEIEHASPYGKDPGEKVPGEKRKIGPAAEREYEESRARGQTEVRLLADGVNCDLDRPQPKQESVRPSDLLIAAAALLPAAVAAVKVGRKVKKKIQEDRAA
jgi:hypothetical protein